MDNPSAARNKALDRLREITGCKLIWFCTRGNAAIFQSMLLARQLGYRKMLIPDQGGWLTYPEYPVMLGFEMERYETDLGLIDPDTFADKVHEDNAIIINSLAGYYVKQPMEAITEKMAGRRNLIIEDISGSIGCERVRCFSDILVCSFGRWKPVDVGFGGFIAISDSLKIDEKIIRKMKSLERLNLDENFFGHLLVKLDGLEERQKRFQTLANDIKKDLNNKYIILHNDEYGAKGINVIVSHSNTDELGGLVKYCDEKGYEYTKCPRYIRVDVDAVSIEVKRRDI